VPADSSALQAEGATTIEVPGRRSGGKSSRSQMQGELGVVTALAVEARPLGAASRRNAGIATLRDGTLLAVSGIGCPAAAESARKLVAAGCRALASWGLAGALDPALPTGAILVPEEVILEGAARSFRITPDWRQRVLRVLAAVPPVERGALLTSPRQLGAVADKQSAFRRTGAAAVDMESYAVAAVASEHGLPFLAIRVIVDRAMDEVPRVLEGVTTRRGALSIGSLLGGLLLQPSSIRPVLHLAGRYRAARRTLLQIARAGALASHGG
jgi:adenosylhomocysteine nucleosidase